MAVLNVHERRIAAPVEAVGALVDTVAAKNNLLWPSRDWPKMRMDRGLAVGSEGGHGPIRYVVVAYDRGARVRFRFTGPRGFDGFHELSVRPAEDEHGGTLLRHTLTLRPRGVARLSWPLVFRWFHDALIEDAFDLAERACSGEPARPARWNRYVRLLRAAAGAGLNRRR